MRQQKNLLFRQNYRLCFHSRWFIFIFTDNESFCKVLSIIDLFVYEIFGRWAVVLIVDGMLH